MKKISLTFASLALLSVPALAETEKKEEKKKVEYHCEKKESDGDFVDIEAKTKEDCKKLGGRWNKKHSDKHKHGEGENHVHG